MAEFPVPLDNLIAYVKTLHPEGGPLENVSDAFAVSEQLDEQSDALLGYFVDQARRSGPALEPDRRRHGRLQAGRAEALRARPGEHRTSIASRASSRSPASPTAPSASCSPPTASPPTAPPPVAGGAARARSRDRRARAGGRVPFRAGRAGREGHRAAGLTPEQVYAAARHRARPAAAEPGPGGAARADLRRFRQGGVQGGAQVGAAHGPQLHRHRAPAARRAVHRRPGRRGVSPPSA